MKHLIFSLHAYPGPVRPVNEIMDDLGITYQKSTMQTLFDSIWLWNCENIPNPIPEYLRELKMNPMECVGYGLSLEDAKIIDAKARGIMLHHDVELKKGGHYSEINILLPNGKQIQIQISEFHPDGIIIIPPAKRMETVPYGTNGYKIKPL